MMRFAWLAVAMVTISGCGSKPSGDTDGVSTSATSSDASSAAPTSGGMPDLPASRCGDGVLDPGEECDDGRRGCACSETCTLTVDPELEWSVPLAPIVEVLEFDLTQQQRAWVVGATEEQAIVLMRIEPTGETESIDLTALAGLEIVVAFHVNGVSGEVGVFGELADNTSKLVRAGSDGPIGEPLTLDADSTSRKMAITSVGVTFAEYQDVTTLAWTGELLAKFVSAGQIHFMDALGDRLVIGGLVMLADPDGGNLVETTCWGDRLATTGTHVLIDSWNLHYEEATMASCELVTGAVVSEVIALGTPGFEVGPRTDVVDAAPNGNPLGEWSVCTGEGSVMGCTVPRVTGFGGPGDPEVIALDLCDEPRFSRLASDRAIYMIRHDRTTGAPSLVRRGTLPLAPPWD